MLIKVSPALTLLQIRTYLHKSLLARMNDAVFLFLVLISLLCHLWAIEEDDERGVGDGVNNGGRSENFDVTFIVFLIKKKLFTIITVSSYEYVMMISKFDFIKLTLSFVKYFPPQIVHVSWKII